jgi:TonB family protein
MDGMLLAATSALRAGSAVLLAAWLASLVMRRRPAAARHAVWIAGLAGMAMLAVLAAAPVRMPTAVGALQLEAISVTSGGTVPDAQIRPWIIALWGAVSAALLMSLAFSHARVWGMARRGRPLGELGGVRIVESPPGMGPMAWGFLTPVVFFPREAEEWDGAAQDAVLRHELAHCGRADCSWLLLGRVIASVFWFQPLAWLALHRMALESERAADDAVLRSGVPCQSYAQWLVRIARSLRGEPAAALATGRSSEFEGRLRAVLDEGINRRGLGRAGAMALAASTLVLLLPVAVAQKGEAKEEVYKIGDSVTAPKPIFKAEPQYTEQARDAKLHGGVLLSLEIDKEGVPRNVQVLRSLGLGLDENAVSAVEKWRFEPGRKDGKPVRVMANIEMNFRLN